MPQLAKEAGATEELKASDPMKWVGPDEHLQSPGRGDPDGGAYQQLTLNLFLSEAEQIQSIDEAENVAHTSSAFFFLPKMILTMCCVWAAIQTARGSVWLQPLKSRKPPLRLPRY